MFDVCCSTALASSISSIDSLRLYRASFRKRPASVWLPCLDRVWATFSIVVDVWRADTALSRSANANSCSIFPSICLFMKRY
jgi:hypothetical protein